MRTAVCVFLLSAATAERTSLKGSSSSRDKVVAAAASHSPKKTPSRGSKSKSSSQLTIGDGSSLETTDMFYIKDESTECTVRYNGKSKTTKCMKISTSTLPNHADGPYCQNGFWDHHMTQYPDSMSTSCLCQRYECDMTCNDLCLSCEPEEKTRSYIIPLVPRERPDGDAMKCDSDNNYGDGLALNGVALAKNDPFEELSGQVGSKRQQREGGSERRESEGVGGRPSFVRSPPPLSPGCYILLQNNIAPLDENGGHSTLQFTYHVRSRHRVLRCHHFS